MHFEFDFAATYNTISTCKYKISSHITKTHLETLFGPLDYEMDEENDYLMPFAPETNMESDGKLLKNFKKTSGSSYANLRNSGSRDFKCEKCDFKTFKSAYCLELHLKAHNDCKECGKTFWGRNGKDTW